MDASEEAELERLEHGCGDSTVNAHGSPPCVVDHVHVGSQLVEQARRRRCKTRQCRAMQVRLRRRVRCYRASLQEKKKYRRAIKIDLKLPKASTALAGVPTKGCQFLGTGPISPERNGRNGIPKKKGTEPRNGEVTILTGIPSGITYLLKGTTFLFFLPHTSCCPPSALSLGP